MISLAARFGFFDLDAAFSAAFILIMQAFLDGGSAGSCPTDLQEAIIVLEHLANEGNRVARQRLTDVNDFSNQVLSVGGAEEDNAPCPASGGQGGSQTAPGVGYAGSKHQALGHSVPSQIGTPRGDKSGFEVVGASSVGNVDLIGDVDFNMDWETAGIFSSFHDPRLPVTGVDHIDWEEMERMFAAREFE